MISNLNFDNLSANTNTVLGLIIDQCVDRRVPHCTFSMTALRDKIKRVDPTEIKFTDNEFRNYFFPEPKK